MICSSLKRFFKANFLTQDRTLKCSATQSGDDVESQSPPFSVPLVANGLGAQTVCALV